MNTDTYGEGILTWPVPITQVYWLRHMNVTASRVNGKLDRLVVQQRVHAINKENNQKISILLYFVKGNAQNNVMIN